MAFMSTLANCLFLTLNTLFMIVAFITMILGALSYFHPGVIMRSVFRDVKETAMFKIPADTDEIVQIPVLDKLGMVTFIMGLLLFLACVLGYCGVYCNLKILLTVHLICVVVMMLILLIVECFIMSRESVLHKDGRAKHSQMIKNGYKGPYHTDMFSMEINLLTFSLNCCGSSGPDDFKLQPNADWKSYTYNGTTFNIDLPPSCCKQEVLKNDVTFECAKSTPDGYNSTITNTAGCHDKMQDFLDERILFVIGGLAVMLFLTILLVIVFVLGTKQYVPSEVESVG